MMFVLANVTQSNHNEIPRRRHNKEISTEEKQVTKYGFAFLKFGFEKRVEKCQFCNKSDGRAAELRYHITSRG